MIKFLHNLQNKPENYRRKAAIIMSFILTLIIIIIWLTNLIASNNSLDTNKQNNITASEAGNPMDAIKSNFQSVKRSINGLLVDFQW